MDRDDKGMQINFQARSNINFTRQFYGANKLPVCVHNSIIRYVGYSCRIYGTKYHSKITAVIHATCAHVLEYTYIYLCMYI